MIELTPDEQAFIDRASGNHPIGSANYEASQTVKRELAKALMIVRQFGAPADVPRIVKELSDIDSPRPNGYYWLRNLRGDGKWIIGEWDKGLGGRWLVMGMPGTHDESNYEVGERIERTTKTV